MVIIVFKSYCFFPNLYSLDAYKYFVKCLHSYTIVSKFGKKFKIHALFFSLEGIHPQIKCFQYGEVNDERLREHTWFLTEQYQSIIHHLVVTNPNPVFGIQNQLSNIGNLNPGTQYVVSKPSYPIFGFQIQLPNNPLAN